MSRVKNIASTNIKKKGNRKYNPNMSRRQRFMYHVLSKISTNKSTRKEENKKYSSLETDVKKGVFSISEEVEKDYKLYNIKKKSEKKKGRRAFSLYNSEGSINCIGILLGMCCDNDDVRIKSKRLFFTNIEKIIKSEDFTDFITFIFTGTICIYLFCMLFFNVPEFLKYNFNFII